MNKEIKEKWINALESGEYTKAKFDFKVDDNYSAIGVLLDVTNPKHNILGYEDVDGTFKAELHPTHQRKICNINDNTEGFEEVIKYIKENV